MKFKYNILIVLLGVFFTSSFAYAGSIKYTLSGTLSYVDPVFTSVSVTDNWSATFFINEYSLNTSSNPMMGKYIGVEGEILINDNIVTIIDPNYYTNTFINVGNDYYYSDPSFVYDFIDFNATNISSNPLENPLIDGQFITNIEIGVADWTMQMFQSIMLSDTVNLGSKSFDGSMFLIQSGSAEIKGYVSNIDSVVSPIPLPSSILLFFSGFIVLLKLHKSKT